MTANARTADGWTYATDSDGEEVAIANFEARITREKKYVDGDHVHRVYTIEGKKGDEPLPPIQIPADKFLAMAWPTLHWGATVVIMPGGNNKEQLRTCIQLESKPTVETVYTATGWHKHDDAWIYTMSGGAIQANGASKDYTVSLPDDLNCIAIGDATMPEKDDYRKTLDIIKHAGPRLGWVIIAASVRAAIGTTPFSVHVAGTTGAFKSELAAIAQSFFGVTDASDLPLSWNSTANANEALAHKAKDALCVLDDFVPTGNTAQIRSLQSAADRLFRAQGNQAGRARMRDTSDMQQTMYPRGILWSTGEDVPEGHSARARCLIIETQKGEISLAGIKSMQHEKSHYAATMRGFLSWLALDLDGTRKYFRQIAEEDRERYVGIGHTRTPTIAGHLTAAIQVFAQYGHDNGWISPNESNRMLAAAAAAIEEHARTQEQFHASADPAKTFVTILRSILQQRQVHVRTKHGGMPEHPAALGWKQTDSGDFAEFAASGPTIGWHDKAKGVIYIEAALAYATVKRNSGGQITTTKQTLFKRMFEGGLLAERDEARQRNTIRVTCDGVGRTCLAINADSILNGAEE